MDVKYLVLFLFILTGCLPSADVSRSALNGSTTTPTTTTGSSTGGQSPTTPSSELTWDYLSTQANQINISSSNLNSAYLVGSKVELFLSNPANFDNANYCLISQFSLAGSILELRTRVIPLSYYDFKLKRTVKILRADFPDVDNSTASCAGQVKILNGSGSYVNDPTVVSLSRFSASEVCPNCTSTLTTSRIRIVRRNNDLLELSSLELNPTNLRLNLDPNNGGVTPGGTCSNSSCKARGFDCCLENQCVKDGSIKPQAYTQFPQLLASVEQERIQNPLVYIRYPQLYYVCGNQIPPTTPGSSTGSTQSGADAQLELLKKDFSCVEHIKSQAQISPVHQEILARAGSYTSAPNCLTLNSDSNQFSYYQTVFKRLYTYCGCSKTQLSEMIDSCPAYEYKVTAQDANGNPTQIQCSTPTATDPNLPINLSVQVSSRSAPHRFFNINGEEKFAETGLGLLDQEGDKFTYLDPEKMTPSQQPYSMNSILGQMSVSLTEALPAKAVSVNIDEVYYISTTSGFYSPCPTCSKDFWLSSLTAFPSSSFGAGLQAIGHSTERDSLSTNLSLGNYEDTIFGRACWIPPTMLPYSHSYTGDIQSRRLARLKTQAALFANGYQKDWFGFNKGAMIGSFDGVSWFAIGKGRIIKSTSKKLYLALNAPFADVASDSIHVVNIQSFNGFSKASELDYDPQYHVDHELQNQGGTCQANHVCETDTDCVTKLGWEYACADVRNLKTFWPKFDGNGKETDESSPSITLDQILTQKRFPSSSTKRCVYRGSGAPCVVNTQNITDLNKKKLLTCAPNFYCAGVNLSGVFNTKVARFAGNVQDAAVTRNHLIGKDANVLGRPLSYLASSETGGLEDQIKINLIQNLKEIDLSAQSQSGLCQPGKALPDINNQTTMQNPLLQHQSLDSQKRTDFISQIGSCPSTLFTQYRHTSCPVLGSDGNYEIFSSNSFSNSYFQRATNQNSCGLETLFNNINLNNTAENLKNSSPYRFIESAPLPSTVVLEPTLARDACLRRAGSVCHTDLDCSPNKLHASQVDNFALNFFGNLAEKSYHSEFLVCGQADPKPLPSDKENFKNYDMSKNRCCRQVGSDLTTYTSDVATSTSSGLYSAETIGLKMSYVPGTNPADPKRYSRLATVENLNTSNRPLLSAFQDRSGGGNLLTSSQGVNIQTPNQWKTLSEANSETCCGGGFIRKFSDGSNDWTKKDRLFLDVTNFKCINSRTPLLTTTDDVAPNYNNATDVRLLVDQDFSDYCKDGTNTKGSCAQYSILDSLSETFPSPDNYSTFTVNTINPNFTSTNKDFYFVPRSADSDPKVSINYGDTTSGTARRNISITVPSFVTRELDTQVTNNTFQVRMIVKDSGSSVLCQRDNTITGPMNLTIPTQSGADVTCSAGAGGCCYYYNPSNRVLKVVAHSSIPGAFSNKEVGITFSGTTAGNGYILRTKPGSSFYYLKRLGKLELSGIPQIQYEPLYCNDNANRLVAGIFNPSVKTATDFNNINFSFNKGLEKVTTTKGLQIEPVFSSHEFKCCTPLGKTNNNPDQCCSGFGIKSAPNTSTVTCALPAGTDLMVYFNRFVSNEGRGTDQPGGGLVDEDFDSSTGEPLLTSTVNQKITELGISYCSTGKVRQGGAFGSFEPEPQGSDTTLSSRIYNLVDSSRDAGRNSNSGATFATGYEAFMNGFRWNHHLYCQE